MHQPIITGDNYESMAGTLFDDQLTCKVNIFNIAKINSEVRGGKSPRTGILYSHRRNTQAGKGEMV